MNETIDTSILGCVDRTRGCDARSDIFNFSPLDEVGGAQVGSFFGGLRVLELPLAGWRSGLRARHYRAAFLLWNAFFI